MIPTRQPTSSWRTLRKLYATPSKPWTLVETLSPDRTTIAAASLEAGVWAIRLLDLRTGTDERIDLTGSNWRPLWKPDGSGFAFTSMRKGDFDIYFKDVRSDGAAQPIRVTPTDDFSSAWSADGAALLATVTHDGG